MKPEKYQREYLEQIVRGILKYTAEADVMIPAIPPSDNKRKVKNPKTGRMVTNSAVKTFKEHARGALGGRKLPPAPVVLLYRVYFKDRRRDAGNCAKTLVDSLYSQDRHVHAWELPTGVDAKNPHIDVWIVRIIKEGGGD